MNVTFLIGNGFDLGLGIHSKFKDFFPKYDVNSINKSPQIKQFADEISSDYDTWADFEIAVGQYTSKFTNATKNDFFDQIKDFETDFIEYLKKQEEMVAFDDERIAKKFSEGLIKFYYSENLDPISNSIIAKIFKDRYLEPITYNFINFNYTSLLEKCLKMLPQKVVNKRKNNSNEIEDKWDRIVHIHGKCNQYPIIGVNDTEQISNAELAKDVRFARNIVKPILCKHLRQGNDTICENLVNKSDVICIYGMSIGATDKKWWNLITSWLSANPNRQLIVFDYDEKYNANTQFGKLDKEDYYIDKLSEFNSSEKFKVEDFRSRIHIAIHKNIFEMDLIDHDAVESAIVKFESLV